MNFLRKLFGEKSSAATSNEPAQPASAPSSSRPSRNVEQPTGDYALVKGQSGNVEGIWLRDPAVAQNGTMLLFLLIKAGIPKEVQATVGMGYYRIDTQDNIGGCFVMWDVVPVPGKKPPMPPISLFG